jgi:hypothetical protein
MDLEKRELKASWPKVLDGVQQVTGLAGPTNYVHITTYYNHFHSVPCMSFEVQGCYTTSNQ